MRTRRGSGEMSACAVRSKLAAQLVQASGYLVFTSCCQPSSDRSGAATLTRADADAPF